MSDFPPITDEQKERLELIARGLASDKIALLSVLLDGEPAAAVIHVSESPDDPDGIRILPVAVIWTDDMFDRLTPAPDDSGTTPEVTSIPGLPS